MTIVSTPAITGGVDTHADMHVAAALDPIGGLLGVQEFPATAAGDAGLLGWLGGFGTVALVGRFFHRTDRGFTPTDQQEPAMEYDSERTVVLRSAYRQLAVCPRTRWSSAPTTGSVTSPLITPILEDAGVADRPVGQFAIAGASLGEAHPGRPALPFLLGPHDRHRFQTAAAVAAWRPGCPRRHRNAPHRAVNVDHEDD